MNDNEKIKILRLLLQHSELQNSSAARLKKYLETNGFSNKVSLPTINKYKIMLKDARNKYDLKTVFDIHDNDEKIINDIFKELSRNKRKIEEREDHRKNIRNELLKYRQKYSNKLLENENNAALKNKILRTIKREICSKLSYIDPKTLNYLYNDEAKKMSLIPKRVTVTSEFIKEIESLFNSGVIQKYILDNHDNNKSVVQMIQDYIEINYKMKLSHSIIQRYFHKHFKSLFFAKIYGYC